MYCIGNTFSQMAKFAQKTTKGAPIRGALQKSCADPINWSAGKA